MTTTVCVECSSEIPAASELCPECGFPAKADLVNCPECQNPTPLSLDACPECGYPLEELRLSRPPAAVEPAPAPELPAAAKPTAASPEELPGKVSTAAAATVGQDLSNQVLQAQIESLHELTCAIDKLVESNSSSAINELVSSLRNFVNSAENTNNDMLSDLITNIGRFVESSEKIKDDMLNSMKEQSLLTASTMQEIVTSFSGELRSAATGIQDAQQATLAEMNGVAQQIKTAALVQAEGIGKTEGSPYLLYICAIFAVFSILNFFITAWVVRLVK